MSKWRVEGSSARSRLPIWRVFRRSGTIRLILRRAESQILGSLLTGVLLQKFLENQNEAASPISFFSWHSDLSLIRVLCVDLSS